MKSVINERLRAQRLLIGAACASVVVGFVACSGSSERKATPHGSAGSDAHEVGGNAGAHQGGSESTAAGETGLGGNAFAGASAGGAASGSGGVGAEAGGGEQALGGAGGESAGGAGGESAGGAGGESAGGAGGEPPVVDPVCGVNMVQVGAYSLWCGKVNEHKDANGNWQPDADCSSGCNIQGLAYCQKFYPTATAVVDVPQVDIKDWKNAGFVSGQSGACNDSVGDGVGISGQAACCAPL